MSSGGVRGAFSALHSSNKKNPPANSENSAASDSSPPFPGIPVHDLADRPRVVSRGGSGIARAERSMSGDSAFPGIPVHVVGNVTAAGLQPTSPPGAATSSSPSAGSSATQANAKKD